MIKRHTISIKNALHGIMWAFKTEINYRIHFVLSITALLLGVLLEISYSEYLVILILIFLGLCIEMVNTAIEEATDAIDTKWRSDLKIAKDVAAGAMLTFAIGALVIASIIFLPKLFKLTYLI